jgi:hypothetical protein
MNRLDCDQVTDRLDDWLAGRLDPGMARTVDAHLAGCASCRLDAEASRTVASALPHLSRDVAPSRELWTGIERRLAGAPVAHWRRGLAVAAVFALVTTAWLWNLRGGAAPRTVIEAPLAATAAEAAATELEAERLRDPGLPPEVRHALGRDLAIINDAIREARAQLRATPADPVAQALSESAVRKKLRLLRRVGDYTT